MEMIIFFYFCKCKIIIHQTNMFTFAVLDTEGREGSLREISICIVSLEDVLSSGKYGMAAHIRNDFTRIHPQNLGSYMQVIAPILNSVTYIVTHKASHDYAVVRAAFVDSGLGALLRDDLVWLDSLSWVKSLSKNYNFKSHELEDVYRAMVIDKPIPNKHKAHGDTIALTHILESSFLKTIDEFKLLFPAVEHETILNSSKEIETPRESREPSPFEMPDIRDEVLELKHLTRLWKIDDRLPNNCYKVCGPLRVRISKTVKRVKGSFYWGCTVGQEEESLKKNSFQEVVLELQSDQFIVLGGEDETIGQFRRGDRSCLGYIKCKVAGSTYTPFKLHLYYE